MFIAFVLSLLPSVAVNLDVVSWMISSSLIDTRTVFWSDAFIIVQEIATWTDTSRDQVCAARIIGDKAQALAGRCTTWGSFGENRVSWARSRGCDGK